jgi:leucyl/phenylalanyl-tRNA--protein transferase
VSPAGQGGFTIDDLVDCYRQGVFPMADGRSDRRLFLVDPPLRGILPLDQFRISRRLSRTVRGDRFQIRVDSAFNAVVEGCAAPRSGQQETWISHPIQALYGQLFARGLAHSIEAWREGQLVGGLYGVALGGAFFGESMFSRERDASKVALAHLVARLLSGGYVLLDTQFTTGHLEMFGAVEIPRADYRIRLATALKLATDFHRLPTPTAGETALACLRG